MLAKKDEELLSSPTSGSSGSYLSEVSSSSMSFSSSGSTPLQRTLLSRETRFYYTGLPSCPPLIGRSSTIPWEEPGWPNTYLKHKVLTTVGSHAIKDLWEGNLSLKVIEYLNVWGVVWTSIDIVRIGYIEESFHPVVLWIGVPPRSLSIDEGTKVSCDCHKILIQSGLCDVDVEIRESLVSPLTGPKLPSTSFSSNPTVNVRNPLTPTLGLPISDKLKPYAEGTGGFFIAEGGVGQRLFLVTARHIIPQLNKSDETFEYISPSAPRHQVILLGNKAYRTFLNSIQEEIEGKTLMISYHERRIANVKDLPSNEAETERQIAKRELDLVKEARNTLNTFHKDALRNWTCLDKRVLGHIVYSPPIKFGFGTERHTQDFAIIAIDPSKIDGTNFLGNVIDLATTIQPDKFTRMMYPNPRNPHTFKYPEDRLLRLKGAIPDKDMHRPPALDQDGEPCLIVIKHGGGTGLTVGRANDVRSCVRNYHEDGTIDYSMEWAILPLNKKSGAFSAPGDSGAVVADGSGRIGGIITSGTGWTEEKDITYVTSVNFIMDRIKVKFPKAHLNPCLCV